MMIKVYCHVNSHDGGHDDLFWPGKKKILVSLVVRLRFVVLLAITTVFLMFNVWSVYLWVCPNCSEFFCCSVAVFSMSHIESFKPFCWDNLWQSPDIPIYILHNTFLFGRRVLNRWIIVHLWCWKKNWKSFSDSPKEKRSQKRRSFDL